MLLSSISAYLYSRKKKLLLTAIISLLPWASWHSTIGYLKNPPEGYLVPGIDIIGGMQEIRQKLRDGGYTNQYEFTRDVRAIVRILDFAWASRSHPY